MSYVERGLLTRHELAMRLRQLASQWEHGEVKLGGLRAAVPELAALEVELSVMEGETKLVITARWSPEAAHRLA
jgi:hypothetical protein